MVEIDFENHANVLLMIKEVQEPERGNREKVGDQKNFMLDSMWDERTTRMMANSNRYRGEFDQISPILDQITGEMDNSEFAIEVSPAGGGATENTADIYAGLIRNIENISNADQIYSQAGQSMVMAGLDGFEIVQKFLDANTFDQDLVFEPVSDWYKSVWFDLAAIKQDKSDANWGIKIKELPQATYKKLFPKGKGISIGANLNITTNQQNNKFEAVTVGQLYYKKPIDIKVVKMTSGAVHEDNTDFSKIKDELAASGEFVVKRRIRKSWRVWSRLLDGGEWLKEAEKTVFSFIPLVPFYGNYSILDTKNKYFGKTKKLMDSQRGLNFAVSGETEDAALTPNDAVWMTKEQGQGEDYSTMNIDRKAVRFYTADVDSKSLPFKMPRTSGNPALQTAMASFQSLLQTTGNMDDPSMGRNPGLQSGVAIDGLISQSNNGNVKWHKSMEIGICHAYRICVDAIPRVYDGARQQRILGEDGTSKIISLNTSVFDQQTQEVVNIIDLSKGVYDVTCSMGPAFQNQQQKESERLISLLKIDPAMIEISRDVLYKNQVGAGMNTIADRARKVGIQNGTIGQDEWTPEEQEEQRQLDEQAAQQPEQPDPNLLIAQAEMLKGQAEQQQAQNKQAEIQGKQQVDTANLELENRKIDIREQEIQLDVAKFQREKDDKFNVDAANIDQGQQKLDQDNQKMLINAEQKGRQLDMSEQQQQFTQLMAQLSQSIEAQKVATDNLNKEADTFKKLREGMGVQTFIGPGITEATIKQARVVQEAQGDVVQEKVADLSGITPKDPDFNDDIN